MTTISIHRCWFAAILGALLAVGRAMEGFGAGELGGTEDATFQQPGKPYYEAVGVAIDNFQEAIDRGPEDAANYVGLAESYIMQWCFGFAPHADTMPAAQIAVQRALALDPTLAVAHTAIGVAHMGNWNWQDADQSLRRAVDLAPNDAKAHHWLALFLSAMGRHEEALLHSRRAAHVTATPGYQTGLGAVLYFARDFPQMIKQMEATTAAAPEFAPGYDWLGMAYVQTERFDDALRVYEKAVKLSGNLAEMKAGLGHAHGVAGNLTDAAAIRDELEHLSTQCHIPPVQMAFVQLSLGERERAMDLLDRALVERAWEVVFLRVEPWLDDLRDDPRFAALERRLGFPRESEKLAR